MRRSAAGARSSVNRSLTGCAAAGPGREIHGILMRSSGKINGETYSLGRAMDQEGNGLDVLVQSRRNVAAAKCLMCKLMKKIQRVPRVLITDKLKSDGAVRRELMLSVEHRQSRYLNNRAENAHPSTRQRERALQRFKPPSSARALPLRLQHGLAPRPAPVASPWGSSLSARDKSTSPRKNSLISLCLLINNHVRWINVTTP